MLSTTSNRLLVRAFLFASVAFLLPVPVLAAAIPAYKGPVTDLADLLSAGDSQRLENKLLDYRKQSTTEIGILIMPNLGGEPLEDFAHDVFKQWGIGKAAKDNGVLLIIALEERRARIEVGYGLEGELTDAECGRIVNRNSPMSQRFRQQDYAGGINAAIDGIMTGIGGEYKPPAKDEADDKEAPRALILPGLMFLFFIIMAFRKARRFGAWHTGSFGGPFGGGGFSGGGGGGGFSFGGGSSGGGGASGGW